MALPPINLTAPPANPAPYGLYAAATVTQDAESRHLGGINLDTPNAGPHGTWPTDCPTPDGTPDKGGDRPDPTVFPSTIVWAADDCKAVGVSEDQARDRAMQTLRLSEPLDVEDHVATLLAGITPTQVNTIRQSVELLEDALTQNGHTGVIHARRGLIAYLQPLIVRQGGQLLTPGGHRWAFGAGYGTLGDTLVGTGPVHIRQSPVEIRQAFDRETNDRTVIAERVVTVSWEAPTAAVTLPRQDTTDLTLPGPELLPSPITLPTSP